MTTLPKSPRPSVLLLIAIFCAAAGLRAADHRDGPIIGVDAAADIGDVYFFLDPTDNTRAIMSMTVGGFIVPGEAVSQAYFDPTVRFQFQIEGTGDANSDALINVSFSPRTSTTVAQNATVQMFQGANKVFDFSAPATNPTLNATAPPPVVATDSASGVRFCAGPFDDPFFFDIPGFSRWVDSVLAGNRNNAHLTRGRDSFAGYNTMVITLSVPVGLLPKTNNEVGLAAVTFRNPTVLANLAARAEVEGGDRVLIAGKIISGRTSKRIIVRALGPSLSAFGLAALSDPTLRIANAQGQTLASNDNWQDSPQAAEISALGFAPPDAKEPVIISTLPAASYTAIVDGAGGAKGVAVVEVFDLENSPQLDRMGNPGVNVALVPFAKKDAYNASNPKEDAAGRFAPDIIASLQALGTNNTFIGILANITVVRGDMLRLNVNVSNSGTNANAAFPNGRRFNDDVIDTLLTLINNGTPLGDSVGGNEVAFQSTFPFLAPPHQPQNPGAIDDRTRN